MTSRLLNTLHETAKELADIGLIDAQTMREFDASCLPPVKPFSPTEIKSLRLSCRASQAVFAAYLNTSLSTIRKWERGEKHPNGPSLKLLNLVARKGLEVLA
ncbi:helix-turn-helix domain-containing protein [Paludibacterium purpuratum]|uniref:Putative transcriptional regulator n=1 Tax=Paludibacterium purpuratum TaxID=1144873 RepID=A0A4R7AWW9_9NEIS|nr:DNA-binding transcriptional regulator [Paludibacterium purpuratum]TDR72024.1 putative transcriptional regulator [Paludibacterium purpuratum]